MKFGLIGGKDIKKYTIADLVWKKISEKSGLAFDFEIIPIDNFVDLCKFYWNFSENQDFIGFNIALPWKTDILKLLSNDLGVTSEFKAINVLYKKDGVCVSNTDVIGLEKSLLDVTNINKKDILILGGGGAGLPTAEYLSGKYDCNIFIYDIKKIEHVSRKINILQKYDDIVKNKYDIIINATPIGKYYFDTQVDSFATPIGLEELNIIVKESTVIQEMNYFPHMSQLLKYGKSRNLKVVSGVNMLIYQALESFRLYTDRELNSESIKNLFNEIIEIAIKKEHELF